MEITFHGAARTVTGSRHLVEVDGARFLLDCGLYQGARKEAVYRNSRLMFDPRRVDALLLSHAHIDHSGNIPSLVKQGFGGPIYATPATHDLCLYMLPDAGHIQEADAIYANKRAARRGEPANIQPLYTEAEARASLAHFIDRPYAQPFEVGRGVTATFYDAGHILGSAMIVLEIRQRFRHYRLAYSGDIGRRNLPLLRDPTFLEDIDYLIMEATYGGRTHRPPAEAFRELRDIVRQTIDRGGKIIIPSFAVGRAQELIYSLHRLIDAGELPPVPVYVDSPLAVDAVSVFRAHPECFNAEAQAIVRADKHGDVFGFGSLKYTRQVTESMAINDQPGPLIIISASGMCEYGRILHHLRNNIEDPRNTIIIVSWQAPDTLGRRIAERAPEVKIFGDVFKLRAQVATINGYSAHADREMLVEWAAAIKRRVKRIFLVHGDPPAAEALAVALKAAGLANVYIPQMHETVKLSRGWLGGVL